MMEIDVKIYDDEEFSYFSELFSDTAEKLQNDYGTEYRYTTFAGPKRIIMK
jgi:hypothetical protein